MEQWSKVEREVNAGVCTKAQCQRYIGKHVQFYTPWGYHRGFFEGMNEHSVSILSPRRYIPAHLASAEITEDETKQLNLALVAWGGGGYGGGGYGGGYGGRGGYGGYGGWGYGWGRWAASWLIIYVLFGLW